MSLRAATLRGHARTDALRASAAAGEDQLRRWRERGADVSARPAGAQGCRDPQWSAPAAGMSW